MKQKPEPLPFTWKGKRIFLHGNLFGFSSEIFHVESCVSFLNKGYAAAQRDQEAKAQKIMDKYGI